MFWEDQFRECCDELIVTTDDGSYGRHGFVTHALADVLATEKNVSEVVAIGPIPMMKACCEVTRPSGVPTIVSLNSIMVDGTGMCGSCRVTVGGNMKFACVDGADFDGHLVNFDELQLRQKRFAREEKAAMERFRSESAKLAGFPESNGAIPERLAPACKLPEAIPKRLPSAFPRTLKPSRRSARPCRTSRQKRAYTISTKSRSASIWTAPSTRPNAACAARSRAAFPAVRWASISPASSALARKDVEASYRILKSANALPAVCGRVCPQESQCEATCVVGLKFKPVAIGRLERFVADAAMGRGWSSRRRPPSPKRNAPPSSAAVPRGWHAPGNWPDRGVAVTIFEALHVAGGVLKYGIPEFRLPDLIIDAEIENLKKMGVEIKLDTIIGKLFTIPQL